MARPGDWACDRCGTAIKDTDEDLIVILTVGSPPDGRPDPDPDELAEWDRSELRRHVLGVADLSDTDAQSLVDWLLAIYRQRRDKLREYCVRCFLGILLDPVDRAEEIEAIGSE